MNDDLISRSELRKNVNSFFDSHYKGLVSSDLIKYAKAVDDFIDNAPTIERILCRSRDWSNECTHSSSFEQGYVQGYEDGKNERPKGKWELFEKRPCQNLYMCSNCGHIIESMPDRLVENFKGCYCGADMRGEEE